MFSDLAIIIVNWNLKEDTLECIASLIKAGASPSQIIIIDNGSTDGSIKAFNDNFPDLIHIIEEKDNLGYAAGANLGIREAMRQKYQWYLLLNNDTIVAPDFIEAMQKAVDNHRSYSILTPIILYHRSPTIIWSMGDRRIDHTLLTSHLYKNFTVGRNWPEIIAVDFPSGCAMMVNRKVFEKIGLLDESLFMYGEEIDFCWRATQAGFKFACYTSAHMWHKVSQSSKLNRSGARYLQINNQIHFYRRYSFGIQKILYFVYSFLRTTTFCMIDLLMKRSDLFGPSIRAWLDGWFKDNLTGID